MKLTVKELIDQLSRIEPSLTVSFAIPGTVYHELHEPTGPVQVYNGKVVIPADFVDMVELPE